jgi:acyl-CoA thioesterase-1
MRPILLLALGAVSLGLALGPVGAVATTTGAPAADAPALVVFGDSLSAAYGIRPEEGWVALLARRIESEGYGYRVVNASVSGATTADGVARLPHVLATHHPAIVVLELGANDGLRGLAPAAMRTNLEVMLRACRAAGARPLLVGMRIPENYGPEYTTRFSGTFAALAKAERLPFVPFLLEHVGADERNFQSDGLHPIAAAEAAVLDAVWPVLRPLLGAPGRAPAAPPAAAR